MEERKVHGRMGRMTDVTRRSVLLGLAAAPVAAATSGWAEQAAGKTANTLAYVGTYTGKGSDGIYAYRWHADAGVMEPLGLAARTPNPSYIVASADGASLYAANEMEKFQGKSDGSISGFRVDRSTGKLIPGTIVSSGGAGPCQVSFDHTGTLLFATNYNAGSAAAFPVLGPGRTGDPIWNPHYQGHGPNAQRQEGPHVHCATVSPENRWVLLNDLGRDQILVYPLDRAKRETSQQSASFLPAAEPTSIYHASPGSGPRSLAFHPNGRWAYSTNELANTVDVLRWDGHHGTLTRVASVPTLPAGFKGQSTAAWVIVSPDGRFAYISNRDIGAGAAPGQDSIAVFTVADNGGRLTPLEHTPTGGRIPRHFALDPSGQWIVVTHQLSASIVVLARDPKTGRLKETGRTYHLDQPTCVLFC
jgi:6-phosphogluconolactonase